MRTVDQAIARIDKDTDNSLTQLLSDAADFLSTDQQKIIDFYSGNTRKLNTGILENLLKIARRTKEMLSYIDIVSEDIDSGVYWELLDILEKIDTKLQQTIITPRYLRSSITRTGSKRGTYRTYVLREGESIESLLRTLSIEGADDLWKAVALENDLAEEDYGDETAQISIRISNISSEQIQDVFDVIQNKSIYGKDISRDFVFRDNDIDTLAESDTLRQSVETLINIRRGDIPEFPNFGLRLSESIGGTINQFSFPLIARQLSEIFSRDDTISNISITNFEVAGDNIFIEFIVSTLLGENIEQQFEIGSGSSGGGDLFPPPDEEEPEPDPGDPVGPTIPDYENDTDWILLSENGGRWPLDSNQTVSVLPGEIDFGALIYIDFEVEEDVAFNFSDMDALRNIDPTSVVSFYFPLFMVLADPPQGPFNMLDSVSTDYFDFYKDSMIEDLTVYDGNGGQYNYDSILNVESISTIIECDGVPYYMPDIMCLGGFNYEDAEYLTEDNYGTFLYWQVSAYQLYDESFVDFDLRSKADGTRIAEIYLAAALEFGRLLEDMVAKPSGTFENVKIYYKVNYS